MKHFFFFSLFFYLATHAFAQTTSIQVLCNQRKQVMDGFGAHQGDHAVNQAWWQALYFDDLGASIYRVDLTPKLKTPYSNLTYYSPWFMGSSTVSIFNLEDPANPNGPENNRVRTYTGPNDYSRSFGGQNAPIAVMGTDILANVNKFTYAPDGAITAGKAKKAALGDFKLIGSIWSPLPWVKVASGNTYSQDWWPGPVAGSPWPFIWGGNFAGGRLDVSNTPLEVFNDGTGPTTALQQFARSTAAYIKGYQDFHGIQFYAISIQNELNFEQFYNSATYPLSNQYISALKAVRAEFDQHADLKGIKIMGPEDLLGGDPYGMWEYGGPVHKNLQYLKNIGADPVALQSLDFFCIHGYAPDGVSAGGANAVLWDWWANGWVNSPAPGIPANVKGFTAFGKKSWMTETSGEAAGWLEPATGFPNNGGWSIAAKIHQALTTGQESAWIYWTFTGEDNGQVSTFALSNEAQQENAPKYVGAKHFFKYIRPNAERVEVANSNNNLLASAYVHDVDNTLTIVLANTTPTTQTTAIDLQGTQGLPATFAAFTSSNNSYWQQSQEPINNHATAVSVPGYGVVTLYGTNVSTTSVSAPTAIEGICSIKVVPNPAQTQTMLHYSVGVDALVRIHIADVNGRIVMPVLDGPQQAGAYSLALDTAPLRPGIYWVNMQCGSANVSYKMLVGE